MRQLIAFAATILLTGCRLSANTELYIQDAREWANGTEQRVLPLQITVYVTGTVADCANQYWPQVEPVVRKYFQRMKFLGCEERKGAIENALKLEAEINVVMKNTSEVPGLLAVSLFPREITINAGVKRQGVEVQLHTNAQSASQLTKELRSVNPLINLDLRGARLGKPSRRVVQWAERTVVTVAEDVRCQALDRNDGERLRLLPSQPGNLGGVVQFELTQYTFGNEMLAGDLGGTICVLRSEAARMSESRGRARRERWLLTVFHFLAPIAHASWARRRTFAQV